MTLFDPDNLPAGLSEADLIDWIEADARAQSAAAPGSALDRVNRSISVDPGLGRSLEAMRVDRAALGALETPAPPTWVAQAVLEEHERQALLALSDMAAGGGARLDADESFSISSMPRWFKPAMAVAALLAVAFGAWQLLPLVMPRPTLAPGPIVVDGSAAGEAQQAETVDPVGPIDAEPVLALDDTPAPVITPRTLASSAADLLAARLDLPVDDALALALQGRLMIVVEAADASRTRDAADAVTAQPVAQGWTLAEPPSELVAAMTNPDHVRSIGLDPTLDGPTIATDRGPLGQLEYVLASTPTVYMARASASAEAVLSLIVGLERLGETCRVVTLDAPLPTAGQTMSPPSARAVLWWDGDPSAWQPWAAIPVRIVERP